MGHLGSAQPWQQCDCLRLWRWAGPTCICQCRLTPALTSARPDCSRSWHAAMPRCHLHAAMPRCHLHAAMPLACCDATGMLRCAPAYLLIKSNTLPRCSWPGAGGEYRAIWRFWQAWPQSSHRRDDEPAWGRSWFRTIPIWYPMPHAPHRYDTPCPMHHIDMAPHASRMYPVHNTNTVPHAPPTVPWPPARGAGACAHSPSRHGGTHCDG